MLLTSSLWGSSFLLHEKKRITVNNLNKSLKKALLILYNNLSNWFYENNKNDFNHLGLGV